MSEQKYWMIECRYTTVTAGVLTVPRLVAGENKITRREDALKILRKPGLCVVDADAVRRAVDSGLVSAKDCAALGYSVVDPVTQEKVEASVEESAIGMKGSDVIDPKFGQMTRPELIEWSEKLGDMGVDCNVKKRDKHDDLVEKISEGYNEAARKNLVLSAKNTVEA